MGPLQDGNLQCHMCHMFCEESLRFNFKKKHRFDLSNNGLGTSTLRLSRNIVTIYSDQHSALA
jgi:hypothetical protein